MENDFIPSALLEKWERDAMQQRVSVYDFGSFMQMKVRNYRDGQSTKNAPKVWANDAQNKFTKHGNEIALQKHLSLPADRRAILNARCKWESLQKRFSQGFKTDEQREIFLSERAEWFSYLREKMRDLRISKEVLDANGLNWKNATAFAYQTI